MQQVYSPFRKQGRPNQIVDILGMIRPELDRLNVFFNSGNYQAVIEVYEKLITEHPNFETDLGKIAFAYYQNGNSDKAESYIRQMMEADRADTDDLLILCKILQQKGDHGNAITLSNFIVQEYHRPEAALLQAQLFRELGEPVKELHAYFDIIRQEETEGNSALLLKAYSEIARLTLASDREEAEYYMYMCFRLLHSEDIETIEFGNALAFLSANVSVLLSQRIKEMLHSYNLQFAHKIHRLYSEEFEKIMNIPTVEVMLLEMTDELIEKSLNTIGQFKKRH